MTVRDLVDSFSIQGAFRVQRYDEESDSMDLMYDTEDHENELINARYEWMDAEIKYMYPSETENRWGKMIPQVVIEIKNTEV